MRAIVDDVVDAGAAAGEKLLHFRPGETVDLHAWKRDDIPPGSNQANRSEWQHPFQSIADDRCRVLVRELKDQHAARPEDAYELRQVAARVAGMHVLQDEAAVDQVDR